MSSENLTESGELRLSALGSRFLVTGTSERAAAALRDQWSRLHGDATGAEPELVVDVGSAPEGQYGRVLLSQVTIHAIEAAAGTRLMLHAAGLADGDGRVLALVGPSGMGKTTASVYLSRHGYGYVTDETVSIGREGDVLPFPRPLSLRRPDGEVQRSPDQLGLGLAPDELTIARIVLLERVDGHIGPPTLTSVPLVDALLRLIPHASALARLPDPLQFMSRVVDQCGGVLQLSYAEMDQPVLTLLSELLEAKVGSPDPWHQLHHHRLDHEQVASRRAEIVEERRLFRGRVLDGVVSQDEALVLVDDVPVRLGEIGLTIWEAAGGGVAPDEIFSVVERRHGPHPDGPRIVREAVEQMLKAGLLVRGPRRLVTASAASP